MLMIIRALKKWTQDWVDELKQRGGNTHRLSMKSRYASIYRSIPVKTQKLGPLSLFTQQ